MPLPHAPCKDCERREIGCHGKCEEYNEFLRKRSEYRIIQYREHAKDAPTIARIKAIDKARRRSKKT